MPTRYRLAIAYDGTDFSGWARQPGLRTVQGTLEEAVGRILRLPESPTIQVAGRTDSGVHARGQLAHVDLEPAVDPETLTRRLRRVLPEDVTVDRVDLAPPGFDARFSAVWRRYVYRLWDACSHPDPLLRRQVAPVRGTLDAEAMAEAGRTLLGLRDFAPFCRPREGATTIRTLLDLSVRRRPDPAGTIECEIRADAFCHSMVRSVVGALVSVGTGQRDAAWLAEVAASAVRHNQVTVLPARGLCLEEVGYPPDDQLEERAARARSVRTLPECPDETSGEAAGS